MNEIEEREDGSLLLDIEYFPEFLYTRAKFNMPWSCNKLVIAKHDNIPILTCKNNKNIKYWNPRAWGSLEGYDINQELLSKKKQNCTLISEYLSCRGTKNSNCLLINGKCKSSFRWKIKANLLNKVIVKFYGGHGDSFIHGEDIPLHERYKERIIELSHNFQVNATKIKQTLDVEAERAGRQLDYTMTVKHKSTITNLIKNSKKKKTNDFLLSLGGNFSFNDWERVIQLLSRVDPGDSFSYKIIYPKDLNSINPSKFVLVISNDYLMQKTASYLQYEDNNIVGLDSIYKLNKYYYPFWNLIVISPPPYSRGIPFATVLSNSSDQENVTTALLSIKSYFFEKFNYNFDPVFMIDKDKAEICGLEALKLQYYLCEFHRKKSIETRLNALRLPSDIKIAFQESLSEISRCLTIDEALNKIDLRLYDRFDSENYATFFEYLENNWFKREILSHWITGNRPHRRGLWNTNNFTEASFRSMIQNFLQFKGHRTMFNLVRMLVFEIFPYWVKEIKNFDNFGYSVLPRNAMASIPDNIEKTKIVAYFTYFHFNDHRKMITQSEEESIFYVASTSVDLLEYTVKTYQKIICTCLQFHYAGYCKHCAAVQYFNNLIEKPSDEQINEILSQMTIEDRNKMISSSYKIQRDVIIQKETLSLFMKLSKFSHYLNDYCIGFGLSKIQNHPTTQEANSLFTKIGSANFNHKETIDFFKTSLNFFAENRLNVLFFLVYSPSTIENGNLSEPNFKLNQDILHRFYLLDQNFPNIPLIYLTNDSFIQTVEHSDPNLDCFRLTLRSKDVFKNCISNLDNIDHYHSDKDILDSQIKSPFCKVYTNENLVHTLHHTTGYLIIETGTNSQYKANHQQLVKARIFDLNIVRTIERFQNDGIEFENDSSIIIDDQSTITEPISPLKQALNESTRFSLERQSSSPLQSNFDQINVVNQHSNSFSLLDSINQTPSQRSNIFVDNIEIISPIPFNLPISQNISPEFEIFDQNDDISLCTSFQNLNQNDDNLLCISANNSIDLDNSNDCNDFSQIHRDMYFSDETNKLINFNLENSTNSINEEPLFYNKLAPKFKIFRKVLQNLGTDILSGKPIISFKLKDLQISDFQKLPLYTKEPRAKIELSNKIILLFKNQDDNPDYIQLLNTNLSSKTEYIVPDFQTQKQMLSMMFHKDINSIQFSKSPDCDATQYRRNSLLLTGNVFIFYFYQLTPDSQVILHQKENSDTNILFRCSRNHFPKGTCYQLFQSYILLSQHQNNIDYTNNQIDSSPNINFTSPKIHLSPNQKIVPTRKRKNVTGKKIQKGRNKAQKTVDFISKGKPGRPKKALFSSSRTGGTQNKVQQAVAISKPEKQKKLHFVESFQKKTSFDEEEPLEFKNSKKKKSFTTFSKEKVSLSRQYEAVSGANIKKRTVKPRTYYGDT